jgi:hypothetical protein
MQILDAAGSRLRLRRVAAPLEYLRRAVKQRLLPAEPTKPYKRTPAEQALVEKHTAARKPEIKVKVLGTAADVTIGPDHPDLETGMALWMDALGTTDGPFLDAFMRQLATLTKIGGKVNEDQLNQTFALIRGIGPQDPVEGMLAAQMAAIHTATLSYARRTAIADTFMESELSEKAFNRLSRTFVAQMDALKKYRTGGEQKMTVEHVHVHEGGQAIVGNVQGGRSKNQGTTS